MKLLILIAFCVAHSKGCFTQRSWSARRLPPTDSARKECNSQSVDDTRDWYIILQSSYVNYECEDETYIIVLKDEADPEDARVKITKMRSSNKRRNKRAAPMRILNGPIGGVKAVVSELNYDELKEVSEMDNVKYVERDAEVHLTWRTTNTRTYLWNLDRIDQRDYIRDYTYSSTGNGDGQVVYVIDSGVNINHEDFGGRAVNWKEIVKTSSYDCTGHGTHVAGTVASRKYGVAKGAKIRSVRAFGCSTATSISYVIQAINEIKSKNQTGVVVMAFGTDSPVYSLDDAVRSLVDSGFVVVTGAGNENKDACNSSPARVKGVITVGASDFWDNRSMFSNYGVAVDVFAPGSYIRSLSNTSKRGTTVKQGTSMAAPHVAGVAAILLERGIPAEDVRQKIIDMSTKNVIKNPRGSNRLLYID